MKEVRIDKLECRHPRFFKTMWFATFLWLVASVVNFLVQWCPVWQLDILGYWIIFLFGISILLSFGKSFLKRIIEDKGETSYTGRIRRLGIEAVIAIVMIMFISTFGNNSFLVVVEVIFLTSFFLYDIWKFADLG